MIQQSFQIGAGFDADASQAGFDLDMYLAGMAGIPAGPAEQVHPFFVEHRHLEAVLGGIGDGMGRQGPQDHQIHRDSGLTDLDGFGNMGIGQKGHPHIVHQPGHFHGAQTIGVARDHRDHATPRADVTLDAFHIPAYLAQVHLQIGVIML